MNITTRLNRLEKQLANRPPFRPPSQETLDDDGCYFWLDHLKETGQTPDFAHDKTAARAHFAQLPEAQRQYWHQYAYGLFEHLHHHPELITAAFDQLATEKGLTLQ